MRDNQKLYVVTRRDLSPGAQSVQGMHALVEFLFEHKDKANQWHHVSNTLCFLSVADEKELDVLVGKLYHLGIAYSLFREPDLGMSLTAIVVEATNKAEEALRELPLALKAPVGHQPVQQTLLTLLCDRIFR